jgi:SAM-dependent methyltransferase
MGSSQSADPAFWEDPANRRRLLANLLDHADHIFNTRPDPAISASLFYAHGKNVLSIGAYSWYNYLYQKGIIPLKITCINVSKTELKYGVAMSALTPEVPVELRRMDANRLEFPDKSFDFVFGTAVLHHLDLWAALAEIKRVLKNDGRFFFVEPLGINPASKIIRACTPRARTAGEKPLGAKDLALIREMFSVEFHFQQLASVPLGILSHLLLKNPENILTKTGFAIDMFLIKTIPWLGPFCRKVIITGENSKR